MWIRSQEGNILGCETTRRMRKVVANIEVYSRVEPKRVDQLLVLGMVIQPLMTGILIIIYI